MTTYSDKIRAYEAGHNAGETVAECGDSAVVAMDDAYADTSSAWHDGYHDALSGVYDPDAACA